MKQQLRRGYTTGSCAAAGARAAAIFLTTGERVKSILLTGPRGDEILVPVSQIECRGTAVTVLVKKDSGDDPDITDKAMVCVSVEEFRGSSVKGGYRSEKYPFLYVTGGEGIGLVTKAGLACPVEHYAINPVPRDMIFSGAGEIFKAAEKNTGYLITVSIPDGVRLAEKTFNPRLGIVGGISVLGSSGIVEPMSEEALLETIKLDIHMKAVAGSKTLAMVPGNYGEAFIQQYLEISLKNCVKCSNFIGETIDLMVSEGIERILLAGHIGKLIKLAGGQFNTHSKHGDHRMEILSSCAIEAGLTGTQGDQIARCNTTEEAIALIITWKQIDPVMKVVVERILTQVRKRTPVLLEIAVFSSVYGLLGASEHAKDFSREIEKGIV